MSDLIDSRLKTQDSRLRTQANNTRDQAYWNSYYSSLTSELSQPSNFALTVTQDLKAGRHILDIGCGNGRDSLYFLSRGLFVTGIDASDVAIENL